MRKIFAAAAIAATAAVTFGASASAAPPDHSQAKANRVECETPYTSDSTVAGQAGNDGTVVNHYTQELLYQGVDYDYVVNTKGDFGCDPYLDNGMIFNRILGSDGSVTIYRFVHESHPSFTGEGTPIWNTWEYKVFNTNGKG